MQERTKLEIEIFKPDTYNKTENKWSELDGEIHKIGRYHSSYHVLRFLEIGFDYINEIFDKFFEVEKIAITKKNLPDNYFVDLPDEIVRLFGSECDSIRWKALEKFGQDEHVKQVIFSNVEDYRSSRKDNIINRIKLLQEDNKVIDSDIYKQPIEEKIELPTFDFIKIEKLKQVLKRDYNEIIESINNECWKSAIILSGSSVEAILFDLLKQNEVEAMKASSAPKHKGKVLPIEEWRLNSLIDTSWSLKLITKSVIALSHSAKEFRNLVHPIEEIKGNYKLEKEEAENAFIILKTLIRDLKK